MSESAKRYLKNSIFTLAIMVCAFVVSLVLQKLLSISDHITTVFVFGVFIISLKTEGYLYGIISAFISMLAVNFAFAFPYFSFNFTIPENIISAIIMIVISVMTSALTTKLKEWQAIKAEGEREKMRANLLRAVSHDLRTPLTTIYGSSEAVLDNYSSLTEDQKRKLIFGIKEDSEWLIRMVENLLSVTRIDGGQIEILKTPTALFDLIDSVVLKFKKRYPDANLNINIPDEVIFIPMDALLIEQVIINILENAVKHAVGMTALELKVSVQNNKALFEISDNGCGIEDERLKHIFTGYYDDAEKNSDTKKRTSGIGLSVCYTIVKAHGALLTAGNREGGGSIFSFALEKEDYDDQQ